MSTVKNIAYSLDLQSLRSHLRPQVETLFKSNKETVYVRRMSDVECVWMGAMIDGEGCIHHNKNRGGGWTISVPNTNVEIISTILRFVGTGRVNFSPAASERHQNQFVWRLGRMADVRDFLGQIALYSIKTQTRQATVP